MMMMQPIDTRPSYVERHLAAIVFADIAGFSRLMATDEARTISLWNRLRHEFILPYMELHRGRMASTPGDAVLIEFPSAISALRWAVDVQRSLKSRAAAPDADIDIRLRIGINVDEVIDDEGVLQSDGVNIASRIHQAASPGEIVLTAAVRELVQNRVPVSFRYLGTPAMKNITRPVQIFAVEYDRPTDTPPLAQPYLQWSTRPTLAVLPFRTIGGDAAEEYFGDGITEDIITGLSRSRLLFVIARTSTLQFRSNDRSFQSYQTIARLLGVRYILNGSVRRQSNKLRINAELIEVENSRSVWAERYDGDAEDLFEFQDRIASSIVASLEPRVRAVETARIANRPTESLDAYDCVLKAIAELYKFTDQSYEATEALLQRAVQLDPEYATAHAYLAWRLNFWIGEGHSRDVARDREAALVASRRAIALDPDDAFALAVRAHLIAFHERRPLEALDLLEQALALDENAPLVWALSAVALAYVGRGDEARDRLQNVWRLTPFDPLNFFFWIIAGIAEFVSGHYEESAVWLRKSNRANPRFAASLRMLAATQALLGDEAEAKATGQRLLQIDPGFRVQPFVDRYPFVREEEQSRLARGLRLAGLPG